METFDGANKKPFKATGLLNKSQLKLASYIKANKDVTLQGTKRFMDKSGEYYLKNIQLQNRKTNPNSKKVNSLNNPQNLENCLNNGNIGKIKKRASKILTILPENSLTPIPKKEGINKLGMANGYGKKELKDAQRTAVFIRRLEYATSMKKQREDERNLKNNIKKIGLIQEWWKTMFKIIKLQKNMRGFLFRKKLMNNLEHQEKLLQFITEFDNIHNYHVYKQFMDNLKRKRDYEKAKLMEKCEDFNEKLDNLEKLHNLKNFKNCFEKWKNEAKKQKKEEDLENLAKKLNNIFKTRKNKNNLTTLRTIKDTTKNEDDKLNDKAKEFRDKKAKEDFLKNLKKAHRLNKILSKVKNKIDDRLKKEVLDKLKKDNDISNAADKLNKLLENKMKKNALDNLKTIDFVDKVDDALNKYNNKLNDDAKKEFLDKLKDIRNKSQLREKLRKWKELNDEMNNRDKILNKLIRHKQNELKKKAEQEKNKFAISSGVNDFTLISDKKEKPEISKKDNEIVMSSHNDLNIEAKPTPKLVFETAGQNFSLMAPEKFEFQTPEEKCKKIDNNKFKEQLDNLKKYMDNNKIKQILDKWKETAEKRNIFDKLKDKLNDLFNKKREDQFKQTLDKLQNIKDNNDLKEYFDRWRDKVKKMKNIEKAVEKIDYLMNTKPKKDALDTLKKNSGMSEGFRVLDKLFNKEKNENKKDFLDKLKKNAENEKALEDLNKLLERKLKEKFLDNLKENANTKKGLEKLDKIIRDNLRKKLLDELKKIRDISKGVESLDKLMNNKMKRDALEDLKNKNKIGLMSDKLEKLIRDKLKRKFLDRLDQQRRIKTASDRLEKFINNKLKKDTFDKLKNDSDLKKGIDLLEKLIDNHNEKLKKEAFDELKKVNDIAKASDILEKLLTDKLKDDTLKKVKIMHFMDILDKMKKNHDDYEKNEKLKKLINTLNKISKDGKEEDKNNLKKVLEKWKETTDKRAIKNYLVDKARKKKAFDHWKNITDLRDILDKLKKYKIPKKELKSKRISHRSNSKRYRSKSKKNNDRKLLKKAFDIWKKNSSFEPTRNVLQIIKKNRLEHNKIENLNDDEKNNLLQKYKNKMMQVLLNIHQRQQHLLLKKYLDKWRRTKNPEEESKNELPKYRKKPKIEDKREFTDSEINSFKPSYYSSKKNIFTQKTAPYIKRYAKIPYEKPDDLNLEEIPIKKDYNEDKNNIKRMDKDDFSDTSSNNESILGNGEYLIQNKKIITQPRNYTSQSFFIDKNNANNVSSNNYQLNTHNTNQLPMTMKGDFLSLIEQNPKILSQKNPRIQVTNATCDLNQIINNDNSEDEINSEEVNYEIDKLNKNLIIDKNKVLSKVIQHCDKDLYSSQKPFKTKKDQWYSVSIPLNDNEAKWEFLNNIKGERDKNNLNKFELIQKETEPIKEEKEENEPPYSKKTLRSDKKQNSNNKDTNSYKLREMNYSQFYRSPMKSPRIDDEKSLIGNRIKKPGEKQNAQKSFLNNTSRYWPRGRNIDRSKGKIEFDPKYRSIDYDNGYDLSDSDD